MDWRLLLEAKKISRYLSLVLTVAGMVMLNLTALWQPWIHFQVPLKPPGDPTGNKTIPINTIFFMRCPDISCMNEYDKNACKFGLVLTPPGTLFVPEIFNNSLPLRLFLDTHTTSSCPRA